ncbi:cell division protein FtsZ [Agitococcus lubricus]|uniref:Cell division protein FtsZ n=1 Tax=Agitococcus lubricus TaxID=1077255 RepID=A0A2T5J0K8_9GAMM|nr:cell division protein FtsZ [Agitococcus lubricus]PTQ89867.1 cell division protein FtsZ [Agitococcus lubricus]
MGIFKIADDQQSHQKLQGPVIKVFGVGGGGSNAVEHMVQSHLYGVDFICANTDMQALTKMSSPNAVQLGAELTRGLGAGTNPEVGRQAALETREQIIESLKGADMAFITAGMGGGTGTGAAPVIAEVAREMGILTVGVVTRPFPFERRDHLADQGIEELSQHVDSLITIPNAKLLKVYGNKISLIEAFKKANNVLFEAVRGISDMITRPGMINLDFADVRNAMRDRGLAMMGTGIASGTDRAREATLKAINSPLLDDIKLEGATGLLVSIAGNEDLGLEEYTTVGEIVEPLAAQGIAIKIGMIVDPDIGDDIRVTVVATGLTKAQAATAGVQATATAAARPRAPLGGMPAAPSRGYEDFDTPSVLKKQQAAPAPAQKPAESKSDLLNIPSFLRRQQSE